MAWGQLFIVITLHRWLCRGQSPGHGEWFWWWVTTLPVVVWLRDRRWQLWTVLVKLNVYCLSKFTLTITKSGYYSQHMFNSLYWHYTVSTLQKDCMEVRQHPLSGVMLSPTWCVRVQCTYLPTPAHQSFVIRLLSQSVWI